MLHMRPESSGNSVLRVRKRRDLMVAKGELEGGGDSWRWKQKHNTWVFLI